MRIVVDTNLLVSAIISPGTPRRLLDAAYDEAYELCTSEALLAELLDVLDRSHIAPRMQRAGLTAAAAVEDSRRIAMIVLPLGSYEGIPIITAREALERLGL